MNCNSNLCALLLLSCAGLAQAQASTNAANGWIYLVKTEPSGPAREAEFNAWYDDIDVPDVLAVPGFRRARRAVGLDTPIPSDVRLKAGDGRYAALYDIETDDIDSSIIDLYVAARKMNALGRSTDALRVVEANYYRRLRGYVISEDIGTGERFFYVQKIICCSRHAAVDRYAGWFDAQTGARLKATNGFVHVGLYELYRVMEELAVGADEIPHLLTIYEIAAQSADEALFILKEAIGRFDTAGPPGDPREVRDSILYRQLSDVRSE
jgi:hypothetical protein